MNKKRTETLQSYIDFYAHSIDLEFIFDVCVKIADYPEI